MNYIKITKNDIANGPGVRCVLWVAGCTQRCKNCQNPSTWDFYAGNPFDDNAEQALFNALNKSYIQGITFSGGHPLELKNLPYIYGLVHKIKMKLPEKDIWLYTGFELTIDDFLSPLSRRFNCEPRQGKYLPLILQNCDVVVDGPYIEEQRDITLKFRGSRNQRLIDVKETLKQGKIITLQDD